MLEQKISLLELELVSAKIEKEQALLAVVKQWQDRLMKAVEEARKDATKEAVLAMTSIIAIVSLSSSAARHS